MAAEVSAIKSKFQETENVIVGSGVVGELTPEGTL